MKKILCCTCLISSATFKPICSLQIYRPKLMGVSIEPLNTCKATHNNTKFSHTFFEVISSKWVLKKYFDFEPMSVQKTRIEPNVFR